MSSALNFNPWNVEADNASTPKAPNPPKHASQPRHGLGGLAGLGAGAADNSSPATGRLVGLGGLGASTPQNSNSAPSDDRPFAADPVERAAIQAEAMPVRRLRKRMVSWEQADDEPQPGDFCGCCCGSLFWSDTDPPRGWCCTTCHPPVHLQAGQFRVVAT